LIGKIKSFNKSIPRASLQFLKLVTYITQEKKEGKKKYTLQTCYKQSKLAMEMPNSVPPPHVLVFPFPVQGHMNCMLHLAEMLVYSGFHVTLLLTDYNLSLLRNNPTSLPDIPRLRLLSIPDGLPGHHERKVDGLLQLMDSLETRGTSLFKSLLLDLCKKDGDANAFSAVTCVIADGILPFMIDASEEIGVPAIAFRTVSASSFWAYYCIPRLIQSGEIPFEGTSNTQYSKLYATGRDPCRAEPGID
jgi:hypothetical protein